MKKNLFLMLMLLTVAISASAKKTVLKYSLKVTSTPKTEQANQITFDCFPPSEYNTTFIRYFTCINSTDERVYIEWENARLSGSKIVFGDDSRITMKQPKADEAVSGHSSSIIRDITGDVYIGSTHLGSLYDARNLKKNIGSKNTTYLTIPIRFSDGTIEEFELEYTVWYEIPN